MGEERTIRLTDQEYVVDRLEDQINWYDKKSGRMQKYYKRLKGTEIVLAALIPIITGLASNHSWLLILIAILGSGIAVVEGILNINKYHENWIEYRSICEILKQEKYMFLTQTGVYKSDQAFPLLVERVESIISKENISWANLNSTKKETNKNG